jgi:hypothetical protein
MQQCCGDEPARLRFKRVFAVLIKSTFYGQSNVALTPKKKWLPHTNETATNFSAFYLNAG